ncbi:hypothetical protein [Calidithermus chliarophilus]|uniref:hypothetical protein n=1 Tax=Calidithermus chliarophilus TaxID=52023 RepID=UPI00040DF12D|nr:hypothetical protein [Calidithermus chliarophilus]
MWALLCVSKGYLRVWKTRRDGVRQRYVVAVDGDFSPMKLGPDEMPPSDEIKDDRLLRYSHPWELVGRIRRALEARVPLPGRAGIPSVKLASSHEEMDALVEAAYGVRPDRRLRGFSHEGRIFLGPEVYDDLEHRNVALRARAFKTIAHEWWHAKRVSPSREMPQWIEEGLADHYAARAAKALLGTPYAEGTYFHAQVAVEHLLTLLGGGDFEAGYEQIKLTRSDPHPRRTLRALFQSWGLGREAVGLLLSGEHEMSQLLWAEDARRIFAALTREG